MTPAEHTLGQPPPLASRMWARWDSGASTPESFRLARSIFLGLLGIVYLAAFASYLVQAGGLIGEYGILPASELLEATSQRLGSERYWRLPSILWLGSSDTAIRALCGAGALLSLLPIAGIASRVALLSLWVAYLSLVSVGSTFFGYQWDALLLECGLLAIFLAPRGWRRGAMNSAAVSVVGLFLLRWLLFRLMLLSGLVKLLSGDPTWRDGSALSFHYFTQPIPTWTSYYAHQLPDFVHAASGMATLGIELGAPFLIWGTQRMRTIAFGLLAGLQGLILATGNYGFFNLLTLALCVTLLSDTTLGKLLPGSWRRFLGMGTESPPPDKRGIRQAAVVAAASLLVVASTLVSFDRIGVSIPRPAFVNQLLSVAAPARSINSYGLFAVMTTTRPEIELEGSLDGSEWRPYRFHWKPGELDRRPSFAGLHMPRLDWQLWFAALRGCENAPWFHHFMLRLLEGSSEVRGLLRDDPFPDSPPKYLRSQLFRYEFVSGDGAASSNDWWQRRFESSYCATVTLRDGRLQRADSKARRFE